MNAAAGLRVSPVAVPPTFPARPGSNMYRLAASAAPCALLVWLCACDSDVSEPAECIRAGHASQPDCAAFPSLCDRPVVTWRGAPAGGPSINMVFMGDGFLPGDMQVFRDLVDELRRGLETAPDSPVVRRPHLFNLHRVDVESPVRAVLNADTSDSALGACVQQEAASGDWLLGVDRARVDLAVSRHVEDPDVVVVILNTYLGRANTRLGLAGLGDARVILQSRGDDANVLLHELGHALASLGDEYSEWNECLPPSGTSHVHGEDRYMSVPNLTTDPDGTRWRHKVHGAVEGGDRHACGVFHPTHRCRMNSPTDEFCPVCSDAMDKALDAVAGVDDGPPACNLALDTPPEDVPAENLDTALGVSGTAWDRNGVARVQLLVDGVAVADSGHARLDRQLRVADLSTGTHELELRCTDRVGSTSRAHVRFTRTR